MKSIFSTPIFLFAVSAFAPLIAGANKSIVLKPDDGVKLVECNITSGDYQQIAVLALTDGSFALKMLDRSGATQTYELPRREWRAKTIRVPCWKSGSPVCGELNETSENQWSYEITGTSGSSIGYCR